MLLRTSRNTGIFGQIGERKIGNKKTDKKIDEEVYKLYGLTEDDIKIVENNRDFLK